MISSAARSTVKSPWKKSRGLHRAPAVRPLHVDLGVERQHHRGVVGRWIGVGEAAAERAAVAHLRIADLGGRLGDDTGRPAAAARTWRRRYAWCAAPISIFPSFSVMPDETRDPRDVDQTSARSAAASSAARGCGRRQSAFPPLAACSFASASSIDVAR